MFVLSFTEPVYRAPSSLLPKCHRPEICKHGLTRIDQVVGQKAVCFGVGADLREATVQKIFLAGIAAAGLLSGSALASDLPVKAPLYKAPIAAPPYNWSGFYVGANFGGGWSNGSLNIPGNNLYGGLSEFIGGVQAGYNFQAGHFLFGVEGEFDGAGFAHPVLPAPTLGFVDQHWIGTVAGRVGLVNDRWLVFAKLGGGWVNSNATLNLPGTVWNGSSTSSGWLAGAGIEYGFKSHWTVKLEYDYLGLSNWNSPTVPSVALNRDLQMVKAGINYKFESGLSAEAEAPKHSAEPSEDEDLQKKSQNPIADLVSVPFQSNTNFNAGPFNRTQEVFNIQPVVPMHLSDDWNVISRTIIPLVSQPSPFFDSNTNGIGDITQSLFLSPTQPGQTHLGRWSSLHCSVRQRSYPRDRSNSVRPDGRVSGHAATLGDRCIAQ